MFKKSRIKIVASITSVLVLLLSATLCIIYITSYMDVYRNDQLLLERYIEGMAPKDKEDDFFLKPKQHPNRMDTDRTYFLSTFYSVTFSKNGDVLKVDNNDNSAYSNQELTNLAEAVMNSEKHSGTKEGLIYRQQTDGNGTIIVFMDNTIVGESFSSLFRNTLIFGGIAVILLFFFSIYLADKIVSPLEESYQKQKQFISDAGHELKTPVSVVSTNAEMLSREIGENQWLTNITIENERMATLIKQLMELTKTENVTPNMERVDFSRIVIGELLVFESVAFEKGLSLSYDSIAENVFVQGNKEQLGQLVSILLDNAIEYCTPKGSITASLFVKNGKTNLIVSNQGTEIPKEQQSQLFERFYRTDFSRTGDDNHYGLGLAIAKAIVTSHHGDISVSCENGLVTFCISISL